MHVEGMFKSHPRHADASRGGWVECVEACYDCAQACLSCADACVAENQGDMLIPCIRLNQDCAAVCTATGQVLSRSSSPNWVVISALLEACATACQACGTECGHHAPHMEHCAICAEACRACEAACRTLGRSVVEGT
jgi:hypothetical protein